jgi:hypothetical protein
VGRRLKIPPLRRRAREGEDTARTKRMPPVGRDGGRRAPSLVPAARSSPEEEAAMAPARAATHPPHRRELHEPPVEKSNVELGPVEKADAEVEPPGSEVTRAPAPATTLALVPRAVHPRGRALTRKPPRDRHRMNGRRPGSLELVGAPMPMRVHRSACSVRERKRGTTNEWWRGGLDREDGAVLDR